MIILIMFLAAMSMQGVSSLEGTLMKAGTKEPVPNAMVELRADTDDRVQYIVASGDDGRYAFQNVRAGRYRLAATHTGFVPMELGQRGAGKKGQPIDVGSNQHIANLELVMTPTAAIFGRIYGKNGQPVIKATVQALKPVYQNGRRTLTAVQTALTNDLGEYRLFWLPPGQYFVGVKAPNWGTFGDSVTLNSSVAFSANSVLGNRYSTPVSDPMSPLRSGAPASEDTRYLPVYFPNTADDQAAQQIVLRPADNIGGIDILLAPLRTRRVRGVVIDGETGKPLAATPGFASTIQTIPATDGPTAIINQTTAAFDVQVSQGPVVLSLADRARTGRIELPAGDIDLDGIPFIVTTGYRFAGQILIEGIDPSIGDPRLSSLRVTLRNEPSVFALTPPPESGVPTASGAFTIQSATAGLYRVNIAPILNLATTVAVPAALQNMYVKSIHIGDTDVMKDGLRLGVEPPVSPLVIVIGTTPGAIAGSVVTDKNGPASQVTVVLAPDTEQRMRVDLYRSVTTDATGRFTLDRIPPGEYKLFAWESVDGNIWQDTEFIRANEDMGKAVTIGAGSKAEIQLVVIPAK